MAFDVMVPFRRALEELSQDNDTRVVVITGAGNAFCAGADLEDAGPVPNIAGLTRPGIARRAMEILNDVVLALRKMHQPVIGAINGAAVGGGFCLSVVTDIRIASDTAHFSAAGIKNGLTATELGMSYLLPRAIGSSRAFEIMLSGRDVDAEEAARIGLVSRTVPPGDLLGTCYELTRSPSSCCGPVWTPAAFTPTWTTRTTPSSSCASPPRTSGRRCGPAETGACPSTATDRRRPQVAFAP